MKDKDASPNYLTGATRSASLPETWVGQTAFTTGFEVSESFEEAPRTVCYFVRCDIAATTQPA